MSPPVGSRYPIHGPRTSLPPSQHQFNPTDLYFGGPQNMDEGPHVKHDMQTRSSGDVEFIRVGVGGQRKTVAALATSTGMAFRDTPFRR